MQLTQFKAEVLASDKWQKLQTGIVLCPLTNLVAKVDVCLESPRAAGSRAAADTTRVLPVAEEQSLGCVGIEMKNPTAKMQ